MQNIFDVPGYRSSVVYFNTPMEEAFASISNPWNMKEVIYAITGDLRKTVLTRQVAMDKFLEYDSRGLVSHRNYHMVNGEFLAVEIRSPYEKIHEKQTEERLQHQQAPDEFIGM